VLAKNLFLLITFLIPSITFGAPRYTEKQIEAMQRYVGKTYWIAADSERELLFLSAPSPASASSPAKARESFLVTEMVRGPTESLYYYEARFASGREGYISVDTFLEELNSTVVAQDPDSGRRKKATQEAETENKREAWIRAQPWPDTVKEAALKKQAILGMNVGEVKVALGKPSRVIKLKSAGRLSGRQEQWVYPGGNVLTFTNGVLTLIQRLDAKTE